MGVEQLTHNSTLGGARPRLRLGQLASELLEVFLELSEIPLQSASEIERVCESLSELDRRVGFRHVCRFDGLDLRLQRRLLRSQRRDARLRVWRREQHDFFELAKNQFKS